MEHSYAFCNSPLMLPHKPLCGQVRPSWRYVMSIWVIGLLITCGNSYASSEDTCDDANWPAWHTPERSCIKADAQQHRETLYEDFRLSSSVLSLLTKACGLSQASDGAFYKRKLVAGLDALERKCDELQRAVDKTYKDDDLMSPGDESIEDEAAFKEDLANAQFLITDAVEGYIELGTKTQLAFAQLATSLDTKISTLDRIMKIRHIVNLNVDQYYGSLQRLSRQSHLLLSHSNPRRVLQELITAYYGHHSPNPLPDYDSWLTAADVVAAGESNLTEIYHIVPRAMPSAWFYAARNETSQLYSNCNRALPALQRAFSSCPAPAAQLRQWRPVQRRCVQAVTAYEELLEALSRCWRCKHVLLTRQLEHDADWLRYILSQDRYVMENVTAGHTELAGKLLDLLTSGGGRYKQGKWHYDDADLAGVAHAYPEDALQEITDEALGSLMDGMGISQQLWQETGAATPSYEGVQAFAGSVAGMLPPLWGWTETWEGASIVGALLLHAAAAWILQRFLRPSIWSMFRLLVVLLTALYRGLAAGLCGFIAFFLDLHVLFTGMLADLAASMGIQRQARQRTSSAASALPATQRSISSKSKQVATCIKRKAPAAAAAAVPRQQLTPAAAATTQPRSPTSAAASRQQPSSEQQAGGGHSTWQVHSGRGRNAKQQRQQQGTRTPPNAPAAPAAGGSGSSQAAPAASAAGATASPTPPATPAPRQLHNQLPTQAAPAATSTTASISNTTNPSVAPMSASIQPTPGRQCAPPQHLLPVPLTTTFHQAGQIAAPGPPTPSAGSPAALPRSCSLPLTTHQQPASLPLRQHLSKQAHQLHTPHFTRPHAQQPISPPATHTIEQEQGHSNDEDDDSDLLCVICWERWRDTLLVHGGEAHMCVCGPCAGRLPPRCPCPLCRRTVEAVVQLELAGL